MSRQSKYVKTITGKDADAIKMLGKTGQATSEQLNRLNGISEARLEKLCNSRYLEKNYDVQNGYIYSIAPKGEKLVDRGLYHAAGIKHDLALTNQYLKLNEEDRQNCCTGDYYCKEHDIELTKGRPDMIVEYTTEQVPTYIEIITENYKHSDIEMKEHFTEITHGELKMVEA